MKGIWKVLAIMAGFVLTQSAWALTIEDDFEGGVLNSIWNTSFTGGAPAQVDFVSEVMVALVIVVPTLDGGEALRVRGGDVMSVSFGTSWICGDDCTLSFATLFNLKDSDPFIDFGEVVVKSETETRVLFHDDVLNTAIPTWHSFVTGLSPGHWDFSVVNANGLDTSTTSEMYLDKFSVMGVVAPAPVPIPATTVFLLPGLAMLAKFRRRRM